MLDADTVRSGAPNELVVAGKESRVSSATSVVVVEQ